MLKNELEYLNYINEHINNVNKAFFLLKDVFKLKLTENEYKDLNERVVNHDNTKFLAPEFQGYCQWFYPAEGETKDKNSLTLHGFIIIHTMIITRSTGILMIRQLKKCHWLPYVRCYVTG